MIESRLSTVLGARRRSVAEVARACKVSRGALHRLYHDRTWKVDLAVVDALCRELRCQVGDLFVYRDDDATAG
jgi:DNA-binding Xre family transcriptional regulator